MQDRISDNARAILLLAGPPVRGGERAVARPLSAAEYNRVARRLRKAGNEPADLLAPGGPALAGELPVDIDRKRIRALLRRGRALELALDRWRERSIWVASRADAAYPPSLKRRLGERSPPLLWGCGSPGLLRTGGLAVVGSRNAGERALARARRFGRLAAEARRTVISGGARGIDRAAMNGALEAGGCAVGVLADRLESAALNDRHREPLAAGRLTLVSPFDPAVRFRSWNALARNKLIYALGDVGLVVDAARGKGGTWSGAVEQLERFRSVPLYVCAEGETREAVEALLGKGALPWPGPETPEGVAAVLDRARAPERVARSLATLPLEGGAADRHTTCAGVREPGRDS